MHTHHSRRGVRQRALQPIIDETHEVFSGRDQLSIGKLWHIEVDVAMIEAIAHLALQHVIKKSEIDDETGFLVDRTGNGDVARIAVAVKVRVRTRAENVGILGVAPVGTAIPVRGGEQHAARERRPRHDVT